MTGEQSFVLVMLVIVVLVVIVFAIIQASKNRHQIKRLILERFNKSPEADPGRSNESEQFVAEGEAEVLTAEEKSKVEFKKLQVLIDDRKQIARDADISHHLWGLYKNHFRHSNPQSLDRYIQDNEWYEMKILHVSSKNGLNKFEFELKGARYKFIDDEEKQNWHEIIKIFSLFLYDDSGRCLIEIPMKVKVDRWGSKYSISSDGPKAFLPGDWVKDFINVKLKNQRIRNQEIRAQKHQERLSEIDDLKDRFGFWDDL